MASRDLNLTVGVGLQLERRVDGSRYVIELLGYRVGEGVIITAPYDQNDQIPLVVGEEVSIRYLGGVSHFEFCSKVIQIVAEPYMHVHLDYPDDIDAKMMRRDVRVPINETVMRLALDEMGKPLATEMINISSRGAKLVSPVQLGAVGEEFCIEMPMLSESTVVTLNCLVRYVKERVESATTLYHHGVEFMGMDAAAREYIAEYIGQFSDKE